MNSVYELLIDQAKRLASPRTSLSITRFDSSKTTIQEVLECLRLEGQSLSPSHGTEYSSGLYEGDIGLVWWWETSTDPPHADAPAGWQELAEGLCSLDMRQFQNKTPPLIEEPANRLVLILCDFALPPNPDFNKTFPGLPKPASDLVGCPTARFVQYTDIALASCALIDKHQRRQNRLDRSASSRREQRQNFQERRFFIPSDDGSIPRGASRREVWDGMLDNTSAPALINTCTPNGEKQRKVLITMHGEGATSESNRIAKATLADATFGSRETERDKKTANALRELKKHGYADSTLGAGAGWWLTDNGVKAAIEIKDG